MRVPSLFVSHGQPPIVLLEDEYAEALRSFGQSLPPLRAVVVLSSQWMAPGPLQITAVAKPEIQKNFYGFQEEIYDIHYDPPGSPEIVEEVAQLLDEKNFEVILNHEAGLDHGVWMPLIRILPEGNVPVIQISLPMFLPARNMMNLGHALAELREKGILIIGSGGAAFNPSRLVWSAGSGNVNPKIAEFDRWLRQNFLEAKVEEILNYEGLAPHAKFAHPTPTNLLPLMFVMGTALKGDRPGVIYQGFRYHSQSLLTLVLSENQSQTKIQLTQ